MLDLIAIGDMSIDVFLEMNQKEADVHCSVRHDECKICFNYADKIPVERMTRTIGGNSANVAVGARRLGLKSAMVTNLGKDDDGQSIRKELWREGVDTRFIDYNKRTNLSTVINYLGERTIFIYHEERDYRLPRLPKSRAVYFSSMKKGWEVVIGPLADYLDRYKAKLAYNPGTFQLRDGAKLSAPLLERCEIFYVNKQEAALYTDKEDDATFHELFDALHKLGPKTVVITDGPKGSYVSDGENRYALGIFDVPVIERTGCGDAFATGFLVAHLSGMPTVDAMRWGSFESASVLQQIGPQAGLLRRPEMAHYEKQYPDFIPKALAKNKK